MLTIRKKKLTKIFINRAGQCCIVVDNKTPIDIKTGLVIDSMDAFDLLCTTENMTQQSVGSVAKYKSYSDLPPGSTFLYGDNHYLKTTLGSVLIDSGSVENVPPKPDSVVTVTELLIEL